MSSFLIDEFIDLSNLIDSITDLNNVKFSYKQTQKGAAKYKVAAMKYARNETYNIFNTRDELIDGTWEFGDYVEFLVFEPKERIIHAPEYEAKIVQIAINNVLKKVYNRRFIYDSYACIDGKGTHKAVDRVNHFIRKAKWEYGADAYIIKLDIEKYFYTISREILKEILRLKIKCRKTLELLFKIIDSADVIDVLGVPLGNTLSQIFANIYMNLLDQFCKRKLSLKYYTRYADDVIVVVKNKAEANRVLSLMIDFLREKLELEISEDKTKIFPISQGVNAYGFKNHGTHRLLRDDSKKKIKRKTKQMAHDLAVGRITKEKAEQILNSWRGHAMHGNSHNFINSLVARNPYIYRNKKGVLKINMREVEKLAIQKKQAMDVVSI